MELLILFGIGIWLALALRYCWKHRGQSCGKCCGDCTKCKSGR